jgi:hypothetical protein
MTYTRATVDRPIVLEGYDLSGFSRGTAVVQPGNNGIAFTRYDGLRVPYDMHHLYGVHGSMGSRYLALSPQEDKDLKDTPASLPKQITIVEHLASSLHLLGITDAEISLQTRPWLGDKVFMPQQGAGLEHYVLALKDNIRAIPGENGVVRCVRSATYHRHDDRKNVDVSITVEPYEKFSVAVKGGRHLSTRLAIEAERYKLKDVYNQWPAGLRARPLARLDHPFVYAFWRAARALGYKGVTEENYVLLKPGSTIDSIRKHMFQEFQEGFNEFCAHTAVSDFPGECAALGGRMHARFTLENPTHLDRIAALKQFKREGALQLTCGQKAKSGTTLAAVTA